MSPYYNIRPKLYDMIMATFRVWICNRDGHGPDSAVPVSSCSNSIYGDPGRGNEHYVMGPPIAKYKSPKIVMFLKTAPLQI